jgi:hypothetical protein
MRGHCRSDVLLAVVRTLSGAFCQSRDFRSRCLPSHVSMAGGLVNGLSERGDPLLRNCCLSESVRPAVRLPERSCMEPHCDGAQFSGNRGRKFPVRSDLLRSLGKSADSGHTGSAVTGTAPRKPEVFVYAHSPDCAPYPDSNPLPQRVYMALIRCQAISFSSSAHSCCVPSKRRTGPTCSPYFGEWFGHEVGSFRHDLHVRLGP